LLCAKTATQASKLVDKSIAMRRIFDS
jgi:hypothetical protein